MAPLSSIAGNILNKVGQYEYYFNYELNTVTWRMFVNKQILQTYNRLVIEKQVKEVRKMEKEIKDAIEHADKKLNDVRF